MAPKTRHTTGKSSRPADVPPKGVSLPERLSRDFGLTLDVVAQASGIAVGVLERWDAGGDPDATEKLTRLEGVLNGLARVMRKRFIATWLQRPNQASGRRPPIDLLAAGDYSRVEEMIYRLEAGEPF